MKGGHGGGAESVDLLVERTPLAVRNAARCHQNTHGTGCTLSSAIAAGLAQGLDLSPRRARPRPMSPRPSLRPTNSRSAAVTARCIIFTHSGGNNDHDPRRFTLAAGAAAAGLVAAPAIARAETHNGVW